MKEILICLGIEEHRIITEQDGRFSIKGNVNWSGKLNMYGKIPVPLKYVYGNFDVSYNNLESLVNAPELVMGTFDCSSNNLKDFEFGPKFCHYLKAGRNPELISLEYAPYWTKESNLYLEGTKIAKFAKEVYHFACQSNTWNACLSWDENMKLLVKKEPSKCQKWQELDEYIIPHKGAAISEKLGII